MDQEIRYLKLQKTPKELNINVMEISWTTIS